MGSFNDLFTFYGKFAGKYSNFNFYVVSLVVVNEVLSKIKDENIIEFNKESI